MIPPWVLPESPETIRWLDDASIVFAPAFGRGMTQRGSWGDPRWGLRRRYRGLRSDQLAAIRYACNESRGQFNKYLVTPHTPLRGSFPTSEVLSNNTFENGTTGWSAYNSSSTLTVADRRLRATFNNAGLGAAIVNSSALTTLVQYAPYVLRAMVYAGKGDTTSGLLRLGTSSGGSQIVETVSAGLGYLTAAAVPSSVSTIYALACGGSDAGRMAGDYWIFSYISLARCALVDNRPTYLPRSDEFNDATWSKTRCTITADAVAAPDNSTTADSLVEDNTSGQHYVLQTITVASAAADFAFSVAVKANGRSFVELELQEGSGSTILTQYFNLSTKAVGSNGSTGANWANRRAFVADIGNGWVLCSLVGRKTNAATSITAVIIAATADGTDSYLGTSGSAFYLWRATLAQSSVPTALRGTSSSAVASGFPQTGSALTVKGLPASTTGLLEAGDWFEVAGQLKQVTAQLNSDAAGLGYLQFRPALGDSPADNDPIIIYQPFGRFIYSGQQKEMENLFGLYGDIEMNLEEVYS